MVRAAAKCLAIISTPAIMRSSFAMTKEWISVPSIVIRLAKIGSRYGVKFGSRLTILNLVVNARDAMGSGGVISVSTGTVHIREDDVGAPEEKPGDYTRICVKDTGCGMPPEVLERAFCRSIPLKSRARLGPGPQPSVRFCQGHGWFSQNHHQPECWYGGANLPSTFSRSYQPRFRRRRIAHNALCRVERPSSSLTTRKQCAILPPPPSKSLAIAS
jgi:hypothetical protein